MTERFEGGYHRDLLIRGERDRRCALALDQLMAEYELQLVWQRTMLPILLSV
jgi:hypothetical protein